MRILRAALLVLFALPGVARAGDAVLVARDLPVGAVRAAAAASAPMRFDLVGLHWQGPGSVSFRTRSVAGRWSAWRPAAPEAEDRPDLGSRETRRARAWRLGNPYWVGPSDRIEWRPLGVVRRLRAYYVWSPPSGVPPRALSLAGSPAIVSRLAWNANEAIRRAPPAFAPAVRFALVHHTAGSNSYTPAQSGAIVRGIELYHVEGNGWNDIGYNFLVDKYGQVFEGRYGGVDRNVVGAHAQGFNSGSVGVAVLGEYGSRGISSAARSALVKLLAWRLDIAHVDPLSTLSWLSGGNLRFPAGVPVFLRAISGHRDTGFTDCPGDALYAQLNAIAGAVGATGLPKLYAPAVRGGLGGKIRFTARLSSTLPWTVTVVDALGQKIASGVGRSAAVDWTWDESFVVQGRYTWTIAAGPSVTPASGTLGSPGPKTPPLPLSSIGADPATLTPDGNGQLNTTTISYTLGLPATVTVSVVDEGGATLWPLFSAQQPAGLQSFVWEASAAPDGRYRVVVSAQTADGKTTTGFTGVLVDRTLSDFAPAPTVFSPNGDGRSDTIAFTFALAAPVQVTLQILGRDGTLVATVFDGILQPGPQQLTWDGTTAAGRLLDGDYTAAVTAASPLGPLSLRANFTSDTTPPTLELLSAKRLNFRVSEPAMVVLLVDGKRVVKVEPAGVFHVPHIGLASEVSAVAWDAAGNPSAVARSL